MQKERAPLFLQISTFLSFMLIILLFIMIAGFALPVFFSTGETSPFIWEWSPGENKFGILTMLTGSILLSLTSVILAIPLALGLVSWTMSLGHGPWVEVVRNILRFMTAIPTVVYGFAAIFFLTPFIRQALGGTGFSWISASLMLAILILPTIYFVMESGIRGRMDELFPGGLVLGFSRLDLFWTFALPHSKNAIASALVLGFGRAVGDTLLPLMLAGNAVHLPESMAESVRTLTAHMALVTANEVGGTAYNSLFAAGLLLLLINIIISLSVRKLEKGT